MRCMYHMGNCHGLYIPYRKLSCIVCTIWEIVMHCMCHMGNCHALYVPYGKLSCIVCAIWEIVMEAYSFMNTTTFYMEAIYKQNFL